jgi:voltage-gated sodium channel
MIRNSLTKFLDHRSNGGDATEGAGADDDGEGTLEAGEHTGLLSHDEKGAPIDGISDYDEEDVSDDVDIDGGTCESHKLHEELGVARLQEVSVLERLASVDELHSRVKKEFADARILRHAAHARFRALELKRHMMHPKPGPLEWVDSDWFGVVCSAVVAFNIALMCLQSNLEVDVVVLLNNLLLVWYVVELSLKYAHHRRSLFLGRLLAVTWNWFDLAIVISGIIDQWLSPLILGTSGHSNFLAPLRMLRLFRILRILKLAKTFLVTDTDWIQSSERFDMFMAFIIVINAIVMSLELDVDWNGWVWVDNMFLTVYVFELLLRLKRWGMHFFNHELDWQWNWLDFMIVSTGALDLWLIPGISIFKAQVLNESSGEETEMGEQLHSVMSLVRLTRLMRVLRLIRVLRSVPPLYTLLVGVIDAFGAMKWVIVLTILTLYGGAIIFTNLVGKGMIYQDHKATPEALEVFGTMSRSMFSLFELMNGDTEVIEPITSLVAGKFLFACFMVISNWAVLAILTAVVSENMIAASNRFEAEEHQKRQETHMLKSKARLLELFEANDPDKNGTITKKEWVQMIKDTPTCMELSEGTHLSKDDMLDLFDCLAVDNADVKDTNDTNVEYRELIQSLKANNTLADKRSILHIMIRMRALQDQVQSRLDDGFEDVTKAIRRIETHVRGEGASV